MKIGIIGAGNIGSTLAGHLVKLGHQVGIANSRGPETLSDLVSGLGENAQALTVEDAARYGDLVVVSIPLKAYRDVPAEAVRGKIVIDTMNYYPQRDGQIPALDSGETTSSELLQMHLDGAYVVKAFNTIQAAHLRDDARPGNATGHIGIPIAGDEEPAKQGVDDLITEIGFDAVDAGPLSAGRKFQPGTEVYGADLPSAELAAKLE